MRSSLVHLVSLLFLVCFTPSCGDDDASRFPPDGSAPQSTPPTSGCDYVPPACEELATNELPAKIDRCVVIRKPGRYTGGYVNIVGPGALYFDESAAGEIDIRVKSILVEYGGMLQAGSASCPFGSMGAKLSIGLYGDDPTNEARNPNPTDVGIQCITNGGHPCFPEGVHPMGDSYCTGSADPESFDTCKGTKDQVVADARVHGPDRKNFLLDHYDNLSFDKSPFGYKTLSVSYGGSLRLFGAKGVFDQTQAAEVEAKDDHCRVPDDASLDLKSGEMEAWARLSGASWTRLVDQIDEGDFTTLVLDRVVPAGSWAPDDDIVVGTTDWYPGHAEHRVIVEVSTTEAGGKPASALKVARLRWPHQTKMLDLETMKASFTGTPKRWAADLRAPVGLLSRSIKIRSLGKTADEEFKQPGDCMITADNKTPDPSCYFGGHVMFRQGFRDVQIQGAEFKQLGQGGRVGHYPVHFHMTKSAAYTKNRAYVKDSAIWDSMTRFVTLHGAQDVTIARNVGWLSTGSGFFAEDSSEINNKFCHNLAVQARAPLREYYIEQKDKRNWSTFDRKEPDKAISAPATARFIPPILDGITNNRDVSGAPIYSKIGSDALMPSMFWIMNAYNELVGNAVSGVHGFGSCYWLLGSALSGASRFQHRFDGIAAANDGGSMAPLLRFRGNACSTAAYSLPAAADIPPDRAPTGYTEVENPYIVGKGPDQLKNVFNRPVVTGTFRPINPDPSVLQKNCSSIAAGNGADLERNEDSCVTTVIDRYTTSYNWAQVNFSSVWLRPWWYLLTNSAITDQLGAGVTFISAGSWIQVPPTYYSLVQNSLFVGTTQYENGNPYAKRSGPMLRVRPGDSLSPYKPCAMGNNITCNILAEGTGVFTGEFNSKRLLNIYDGPAYASGNTFINVGAWDCDPQRCARKPAAACFDALPCASDQKGEASCEKELPCGVYAYTQQPHPNDAVPTDPAQNGPDQNKMVVLDAAIGWKQPNGFYYPPAFAHEDEIFFKEPPPLSGTTGSLNGLNQCWAASDVDGKTMTYKPGDCRHNVVDRTRTYTIGDRFNLSGDAFITRPTEEDRARRLPVTPIDFQTILLDLDGSLTGARSKLLMSGGPTETYASNLPTSSVSRNAFFDAPRQADECLSFGVQTSPYQYVSTMMGKLKASPTPGNPSAIFGLDNDPAPAQNETAYGEWASFWVHDTTNNKWILNPGAPMVAIYRQWKLEGDKDCTSVCDPSKPQLYGCGRASFMMGPNVGQAVQLTMSPPRGIEGLEEKGFYYVDTNSEQQSTDCVAAKVRANNPAKFVGGKSYVLYNMFARNDTKVSYSFYVGTGATLNEVAPKLVLVNPHKKAQGAEDYDSAVSFHCDASGCPEYFHLADGVLTVTLDHAILKERFLAKNRAAKEQCLTRDLCRFDANENRCVSCFDAAGKSHPSCKRSGNEGFLASDAKTLAKEIQNYCDWSTRATGTRTETVGELSLVDCPEGGCLGLAFTLPSGFTAKRYEDVFPPASIACFPDTWSKNSLVTRKDGANLADPTCGEPKPTAALCQ